jgi:suppressor of ftsI
MWSSRYCRLPTRNPAVAIRVVMLVVCLITTVLACGRGSQTTESSTLQDPPELVSHDGVLNVRLVVERRQVNLAGRTLWTFTYNGRYMPPTLRIHPGDRVELALENRLGTDTNLHTHGLHVSPSGNSDNIFIHVDPGQTFHYSYQFPTTLKPGTYWYHPHAHPLTAPQVGGGVNIQPVG